MIRLAASHIAATVPLVTAIDDFPGIPIGRSLLDGRPFNLSPVLVDDKTLPSTNCLTLGGLGSGKSTTDKIRMLRGHRHHGNQGVVIDSFGENNGGEWGPLTRTLGGQVIRAGDFRINPCSPLLPVEVREELIRSLILAAEPRALTSQSTHALQHALQHPKSTNLNSVVDALVSPEDGRWKADKLESWGEEVAIALSRYTEGSLMGLFDGEEASLPPTDLPLITFDFSSLDRNSPAIPSLMAAVSVWIEQIWLPQSTANHRDLVLEEAWQILRNPSTTELIQRLLKNSRKANLSITAIMHTLSDLGDGRAQDLARLCEVAHIGRLAPKEAAAVGALLGLPDWAIAEIPTLGPGEAVWRVGPHYVDIVKTILTDDEADLTDTSSRRRQAQQSMAAQATPDPEEGEQEEFEQEEEGEQEEFEEEAEPETEEEDPASADTNIDTSDYVLASPVKDADRRDDEGGWDFDMPHGVIDSRHYDVVQAARSGRYSEASELAVIGEAQDIRSYGINSDEALSWLSTRAVVADLGGRPDTATQLRATVIRMGKDVEWWHQEPENASTPPAEHYGPLPPSPAPAVDPVEGKPSGRRRMWPYVAVVAAVAFTAGGILQTVENDKKDEARQQKAAAFKGKSGASIVLEDVNTDLIARWTQDHDRVIVELRSYMDPNARYLRIDASGKSAVSSKGEDRWPKSPELELPVKDPLADVTVRIEIGGKTWQEGGKGSVRTVRLSPTGVAYDADTGRQLPPN